MTVFVIIGVSALVGAFIQGCLGFGVGVVAAPVVTLIEPALMPVSVLMLGAAFAIATTVHDWSNIDWRGVCYALLGRVPGMIAAVLVVSLLPLAVLEFVVAVSVLLAVVFSGRRVPLARTNGSLLLAGAASGFTGTVAGIGGPPMALLYQSEDPATLRGTLGAFFSVGAAGSLLLLALAGQVDGVSLVVGIAMTPLLACGFLLAAVTRSHISGEWLRRGVLFLAIASALSLIVRSLT